MYESRLPRCVTSEKTAGHSGHYTMGFNMNKPLRCGKTLYLRVPRDSENNNFQRALTAKSWNCQLEINFYAIFMKYRFHRVKGYAPHSTTSSVIL